ncbi:amidase [Citricoccus sp. GCM10030269]|uniref:amidase n=1 Tax=Citricoccus sp. GCM10030269 TaxID=3273388 RepID=UPI003616864C
MTLAPSITTPLTISTALEALRKGELTSVELMERCFGVSDALDGDVGMYISEFREQALDAASRVDRQREAGLDPGPLAGIPVGIKDIITTAEGQTTAQSLVLDREWGRGDAVVVERLRSAGAIPTGKLTTMEFACAVPDPEHPFPIPRNPWALDRWAGGSSSGSGSAVATGSVLGALGTDTAGSIRIPASYCGITGLMPTFGRVPKSGCVPLGYSLDHIGPMTRSARDSAIMLSAMAGHHPSDRSAIDAPVVAYEAALTGDLAGLSIGVDLTSGFDQVNPDSHLRALLDDAVLALERRGATITEVQLPHYEAATTAMMTINAGESGAYHRVDTRTRLADYTVANRLSFGSGTRLTAADYVQAQRARRVIHREASRLFEHVDLVMTPTMFTGALAFSDLDDRMSWFPTLNTPYWDLTGNPVLSVPIGFGEHGTPLAMQLAGRPFDEATVLRAGDAFQRETAWHLEVPPIAANAA